MITTIGFEKATFGIYDEKDEKVTEKVEVNGKNKKGGTVEADISGLDAEAIKVFASNGPYHISKKGSGDVKQTIGIMELPFELGQKLLGRQKNADGIVTVGKNTAPPYASCVMESETLRGEPVFFALLKGKYGQDDVKLNTSEDKPKEPEATSLTGEFVYNDAGDVFAMAVGEEFRDKIYSMAFPGFVETPVVPEG
ncbi:major tail protein [Listeria innocua]|uniref:major tail protein n=1 Tax=Listeria innocua TaxID=1642 RepID=UPI0024547F3C|nr:major tail protein [Listeria innocua]MDH4595916.1 phage tail protein [Listeria innocua]